MCIFFYQYISLGVIYINIDIRKFFILCTLFKYPYMHRYIKLYTHNKNMWTCGNCCSNKLTEVEFETKASELAKCSSIGFNDTQTNSTASSPTDLDRSSTLPELNRSSTIRKEYRQMKENENAATSNSTQSTSFAPSSYQDAPDDSDSRKQTLRKIVKTFARTATKGGIEVTLVDETLKQKSNCLLVMNSELSTISISSLETTATDISISVEEISLVSKSHELDTLFPDLCESTIPIQSLVAIIYTPHGTTQKKNVFLTFSDGDLQLHVYASLRILSMAVEMNTWRKKKF